MALVYKIQEFLKRKFGKKKINLKDFSRKSSIPYTTVTDITKGYKLNPDISNILKIANYFRCSIDEVIGRNDYTTLPNIRNLAFHEITSEEIITNIRKFLENKVKKQNLDLYKLSIDIGFGIKLLHKFVNVNREQKTLYSEIIVALADYFQMSLDEMVGRIKPNTSDNDEPSQQHTNE
ncbi:helix-turn-helix transcriptional regulator [Candidatus Tisiphia endosymbiont of Sialis lutaria]|uniref:helix-turn-helix domain-containing protein n=1 Tax=Candidatus Tisiphia endosymbiont of Sialis lutaria TaxID=2029164 RepID=UPI00312C7CED